MSIKESIVSLTSDFGIQSQGVGIMEGVVYSIVPKARLIHLMHGLPEFDIAAASRTLETLKYMPVGFHVCVCDPGVGTSRHGLIIEVGRGDYLIGPDNGVLIPAAKFLGGIKRVHTISNPEYMLQPVSPIFHGRDVFAPAAAHLFKGVPIAEFGKQLEASNLVVAPYEEAVMKGDLLVSRVIHVNKFGSLHLNITHDDWEKYHLGSKKSVKVILPDTRCQEIKVGRTFGDVPEGEPVILKDDYGRVEVAVNLGSFSRKYSVDRGAELSILLND